MGMSPPAALGEESKDPGCHSREMLFHSGWLAALFLSVPFQRCVVLLCKLQAHTILAKTFRSYCQLLRLACLCGAPRAHKSPGVHWCKVSSCSCLCLVTPPAHQGDCAKLMSAECRSRSCRQQIIAARSQQISPYQLWVTELGACSHLLSKVPDQSQQVLPPCSCASALILDSCLPCSQQWLASESCWLPLERECHI